MVPPLQSIETVKQRRQFFWSLRGLGLRAFLLCLGLSTAAHASTGVYIGAFDPIQQAQIDAARMAAVKFNLDRVVFVLDPTAEALESLETRWQLLAEVLKGEPQFQLPKLEELKGLSSELDFGSFLRKLSQGYRDLKPLLELDSQQAQRALFVTEDAQRGASIFLVGPGQKAPKGSRFVRLSLDIDQTRSIHDRVSMSEQLLPSEVAKAIRRDRLYRHDGRRGYYSLPKWLTDQVDIEQKWNDRIENTKHFQPISRNDLPKEFWPERRPVFALYHADIPLNEVHLVEPELGSSDLKKIVSVDQDKVRFFVHPHSSNFYQLMKSRFNWSQKYWATPTSSFRSLIVWNPDSSDPPFGLKLSLDARIGGAHRILSASQIERAAVASAAFRESGHAALEAQGIRVVDEPLGVIRLELGNGFALRELAEPSRGASLVPMFGLYSQRPGREALIHEMIEASGKSAQDFVDRQIIEPLIRHFHFIYWRIGLIGEPHEQNVLMEVQDLKPTGRFFYRDMAGFHLDLSVRARLGTGLEFLPPGIGMASLKLGRARLTDNAVDYLLRSNFYSLQKSVAARYPEVTQDFVEERFRYHMQRQFYKQGGIKTGLQIPDWVAAMKRTGQQHRFSDMSCADLFRVLMRESL